MLFTQPNHHQHKNDEALAALRPFTSTYGCYVVEGEFGHCQRPRAERIGAVAVNLELQRDRPHLRTEASEVVGGDSYLIQDPTSRVCGRGEEAHDSTLLRADGGALWVVMT